MIKILKTLILIIFVAGSVNSFSGVFASPVIKAGTVKGDFGVLTGARFTLILDNLMIGGAFYSHNFFRVESEVSNLDIQESPYLELSYFGADLGVKLFESESNHVNINVFGGIAYTSLFSRIRLDEHGDEVKSEYGEDWFYIVEPGLYYNGTITSWLHYETGVSYRLALDANYTPKGFEVNYNDNDYKGFAVNFALQFGLF